MFIALLSIPLFSRKVTNPLKLVLSYFILATVLIPPHIIVKEFIVFDTYPYAADATYLLKHGHIAWIHRLGTTPGYAITYAALGLISGLNINTLIKAYSLFILASLPILLASVPRSNIAKITLLILPFVFFPTQPINFHRATMFLPYIPLVILILKLNLERQRYGLLLGILVVIAAASVYPMTAILVFLMAVTLALIVVLEIIITHGSAQSYHNTKAISTFILGSLLATLIYYTFFSLGGYTMNKDFLYMLGNAISDIKRILISPPTEIVHQGIYSAQDITPELKFVVMLRTFSLVILTLMTLSSCLLWLFKAKRSMFQLYLICLWLVTLLTLGIASFLLHYKGFLLKFPYTYVLLSCITLTVSLETMNVPTSVGKYLRVLMPLVLTIQLLIIPLTSYASLPIIHLQVTELEASRYIIRHYIWAYTEPQCNKLYYIEYSSPWNFDLLAYDKDIMSFAQVPYNALLNISEFEKLVDHHPILITSRLILRDYYIVQPTSHAPLLDQAIVHLTHSKNLVYVSVGSNEYMGGSREFALLYTSK